MGRRLCMQTDDVRRIQSPFRGDLIHQLCQSPLQLGGQLDLELILLIHPPKQGKQSDDNVYGRQDQKDAENKSPRAGLPVDQNERCQPRRREYQAPQERKVSATEELKGDQVWIARL